MQFIDLKTQYNIINKQIKLRINKVLKNGQYIMGEEIDKLESSLANFVQTKYCISCSSGTDALIMALMAKNAGPGKAIITTPFTYIATAEAIQLVGATPVFIDIDKNTFNINPNLIEEGVKNAIKNNLDPVGIIPVDLFGLPANYFAIKKIAKKYNLFIIEDAAQGLGGKFKNKFAGSFGNIGITSFFPAKPLGCYGDGGAIFTNNKKIAHILKSIRTHGQGMDKYDNIRLGINGRLDTIQAAILLEKINIFKKELKQRNQIAKYYTENLPKIFSPQLIPNHYTSSWAQYSIVTKSKKLRNKTVKIFNKYNIPTMIYYKTPLHLQKVFKFLNYTKGDFPISENISEKILSLPMHPYLSNKNQNKILKILDSI